MDRLKLIIIVTVLCFCMKLYAHGDSGRPGGPEECTATMADIGLGCGRYNGMVEKTGMLKTEALSRNLAEKQRANGKKNVRVSDKDLKRAISMMNDKNLTKKNKQWIVETLEDALAKDSAAKTIYHLASAYRKGLTGKPDMKKAIELYEKSGEKGYTGAYSLLGMMFKDGDGVKQDFDKSYEYFCKSADLGSAWGIYCKGYMLYKGLGCKQDYLQAAMAFLVSGNMQSAPSWYMLGLCSRNGYGLMKDSLEAISSLSKAVRMGMKEAKMELDIPNEEVYMNDVYRNSDEYKDFPAPMPQCGTDEGDSTMLGSGKGHMIIYDWSGEYILKIMPLSVMMKKDGRNAKGYMVMGTDTVNFGGNISDKGVLRFRKSTVTLPERYKRSGKQKYRLDCMALKAVGDNAEGRLKLEAMDLKEPGRPIYVILDGKGRKQAAD